MCTSGQSEVVLEIWKAAQQLSEDKARRNQGLWLETEIAGFSGNQRGAPLVERPMPGAFQRPGSRGLMSMTSTQFVISFGWMLTVFSINSEDRSRVPTK